MEKGRTSQNLNGSFYCHKREDKRGRHLRDRVLGRTFKTRITEETIKGGRKGNQFWSGEAEEESFT